MLMQAVLNLAINALPGDARRRLAAPRLPPAARRRVALSVEDTGVGIPPENLPRIFDLYFTTKEKGSGIGLSMVFRIVQLHDGEVEVQSTPGGARRVHAVLPAGDHADVRSDRQPSRRGERCSRAAGGSAPHRRSMRVTRTR